MNLGEDACTMQWSDCGAVRVEFIDFQQQLTSTEQVQHHDIHHYTCPNNTLLMNLY